MKTFAIPVVLLFALSSTAAGQCPANTVSSGSSGHGLQYESFEPSYSFDGSPVVAGASCSSCYSWPDGYVAVGGAAPSDWFSYVLAVDRFQIVGPASATPIDFSVRLRVSGSADAQADGYAEISQGTAVEYLTLAAGQTLTNEAIVLPLQKLPDEPFELRVVLSAGSNYAYAPAELKGFVEFVNLPASWSIISCQGFDVPVPVKKQTWGGVRAAYR